MTYNLERFDNIRITGNPATDSTLYHLYGDHPSAGSGQALGSTSVLSDSSGNEVAGSRTRHLPFGGWRGTAPTQTVTDRAFTGQKENMEVGLLYFNARYYLSNTNRFISADTIVPNPTNPQSWNRYSYVRNNPINFTDPTGHRECGASDGCSGEALPGIEPPPLVLEPPPSIPAGEMVTFNSVEGCTPNVPGACTWSDAEKATIQESATATGTRLTETLNAAHPGWNLTPTQAFLLVYGGSVNFLKTGQTCEAATGAIGCWGKTFYEAGVHEIRVYSDIFRQDSKGNWDNYLVGDAHWAVHELGHAFVNTGRGNPVSMLEIYQAFGFPNRPDVLNDPNSTWGFAGGRWEWQRSWEGAASEEFADMYLGWVYNQWEMDEGVLSPNGQMRAGFMNSLMPIWLNR